MPVSLRVVLRPEPEILARLFEGPLSLPAKLLISSGRIGSQVEHVTVTTGSNFVREIPADSSREGMDHLEDSASPAGSEVPGADTRVVSAEVVESFKVTIRQVKDVNIISDSRAVVGGVIC